MNSEKLSDWLQIGATLGVIASLIFVGVQIKQSHQIALSSVYQTRAQIATDTSNTAANTPEFTSATAKIYSGEIEKITSQEMVALEYITNSNMVSYENQHMQYEMGFLPEEHWQRNLDGMHCFFSHPLYRDLVLGWQFRESFQTLINDVMARAVQNPSNCWEAASIKVE